MKGAAVAVQVSLFTSRSPLELDDPDGVEPGRLHKSVPTALQEAKPKAGTIFRHLLDIVVRWTLGDTDRRRESSPEANPIARAMCRRNFCPYCSLSGGRSTRRK
jgi:hypothetical protein